MASVPTLDLPSGHSSRSEIVARARFCAMAAVAVFQAFSATSSPAAEGEYAMLTASMSGRVIGDPLTGTVTPKILPGSILEYSVTITNGANSSPAANSVIVGNPVPDGLKLFVGDLEGPGTGPVAFTDGPQSSALDYQFLSLASSTDAIEFSDNGGASFDYSPVPDGNGYDANVTNFRIVPSGVMAPAATTPTSFAVRYRVRVK